MAIADGKANIRAGIRPQLGAERALVAPPLKKTFGAYGSPARLNSLTNCGHLTLTLDRRGMVDTSGTDFDETAWPQAGGGVSASEIDAWFVREVLPLEATLIQFLRRNSRNRSDVADLCQEVYMRVYEAAKERLPERTKPFVFAISRNLLIDRVKHEQVVPIETVADLDTLNIAIDEPGPDRVVMARDTLRRLQAALERLPQRCREAVVMRKIEGLSRSEIALRMGITEHTVNRHLTDGMCQLADLVYGEPTDTRSPT